MRNKLRNVNDAGTKPGTNFNARNKNDDIEQITERYPVAITPTIVEAMDASDPHDPLARQFIPDISELQNLSCENDDPTGDQAHSPVAGLVHRYPDRVLLMPVLVCPVYCRFCFRRETVGQNSATTLSKAKLTRALNYIEEHPQIWEVILSGGDPLILSANRIAHIVKALAKISHVKIVRIHSRIPVVDPDRINDRMITALTIDGITTYVVLHTNHPNELTKNALLACARIIDNGIPMLSQTVLLKGINDSTDVMGELMRLLVEHRIKPYYLHHADLAPGTGHFRTTIDAGQLLIRELRGRYSGLCQPTYVLDIPGGFGKSPIGPHYIRSCYHKHGPVNRYHIQDYNGVTHDYPPDSFSSFIDKKPQN